MFEGDWIKKDEISSRMYEVVYAFLRSLDNASVCMLRGLFCTEQISYIPLNRGTITSGDLNVLGLSGAIVRQRELKGL